MNDEGRLKKDILCNSNYEKYNSPNVDRIPITIYTSLTSFDYYEHDGYMHISAYISIVCNHLEKVYNRNPKKKKK